MTYLFKRSACAGAVFIALALPAAAQTNRPDATFGGRDASYELSAGSQLRTGDRLLDKLVYTVWERTTVKGAGSCTQGACPVIFNGVEVYARRSRLTILSGGTPGTATEGLRPGANDPGRDRADNRYPAGWKRLQRGDSGDRVRDLQERLIKDGARDLTADGRFGRSTEAAIRDLQRRKSLSVDGVAGFETLRALGV